MVVELKIDGHKVDMNQKGNIAATHSIADIEEPDSTAAGYTKSVEVPLISNMRVFRFINELYSKEQFNNELHKAEYIVDGNTVMSGIAQIDKITYKFGSGHKLVGGSFHVSIIGAAFDWITNAKKQINELESAETVVYNMGEVYKNSIREDESLIKFFPVDRGAFWEENYNGDLIPRKKLDIRDYHPFFNVWKTMCLILSGYTIKSSMEDFFKKLYCSGYMPVNEDLSYIKEDNDFYIGTSATEDEPKLLGMISPKKPTISANIYDLWDSDEYHNDKGVISSPPISSTPHFNPTETVTVRMQTNLHYKSQIVNGSTGYWNDIMKEYGECLYVDEFRLYVNAQYERIILTLDKCVEAKDRQGDIKNIFIPCDPNEAKTYVVYLEFASWQISGRIIFQCKGAYTDLGQHKAGGRGNWYVITVPQGREGQLGFFQGISMHDGVGVIEFYYFEIYDEQVTFNLDNITKNAYTLTKGLSYPLWGQFACSREYGLTPDKIDGVQLWLCENNSIKPDFANIIGQNDKVGISTIGGTGSQLDFLASLRQLFNLMYYTNPLSKEIFVEPRTKFYNLDRAEIVDWREKIDYAKEIVIEELGADIGKSIKLAYAEGNEVIQYYNWKTGAEFGAYSQKLLNKTSDDTKEIVNDTFSPFLLHVVDSVGMTILQEERESEQKQIDDIELEVTPVIGCFGGLADRTGGEDVASYPKYPQLVFQDIGKGINLGFDDMTGDVLVPGSRQYYEDNISAYNHGRRITMYLELTPRDIEAIQFPNSQMQDFRAVYLLNFDGEDVPCLLEQIADYNPATGASTKCVFISDPHIKLTGDDLTVITYDDVAIGRNNTLTGYR